MGAQIALHLRSQQNTKNDSYLSIFTVVFGSNFVWVPMPTFINVSVMLKEWPSVVSSRLTLKDGKEDINQQSE